MARAGPDLVEIRHANSGHVKHRLAVSGLHCSLEVRGVLYLGTQYKQVYAIDSKTYKTLAVREVASSVNSLVVSEDLGVILAAQSGGLVAVFKISSAGSGTHLEKQKEVKLCPKNISKIVRTSRSDFALATETGVYFAAFKPPNTYNLQLTQEAQPCLDGKDITELSEYAHDQFVAGQWSENDFLIFDRKHAKSRGNEIIKQPLWCNALCTDLVPLPGYHPVAFPFYLAKTMRSVNLLDFKNQECHVLV